MDFAKHYSSTVTSPKTSSDNRWSTINYELAPSVARDLNDLAMRCALDLGSKFLPKGTARVHACDVLQIVDKAIELDLVIDGSAWLEYRRSAKLPVTTEHEKLEGRFLLPDQAMVQAARALAMSSFGTNQSSLCCFGTKRTATGHFASSRNSIWDITEMMPAQVTEVLALPSK